MSTNIMFTCLILLGALQTLTAFPNVQSLISESEQILNDESFRMHIVPSRHSMKGLHSKDEKIQLADIISEDDENYKLFTNYMDKGYAMKGLTFNIYDDNIREATIALFNLFRNIDPEEFMNIRKWAKQNINDDMFDYVERLLSLYGTYGFPLLMEARVPPFIFKPHFYVNGETIIKALKIKSNNGEFNYHDAKVNQYYRTDNMFTFNSNYSNWNPQPGCENRLDYFTEDISLNSYYYGLHLLHPFWMTNDELDDLNPRHAEHYYFNHKQLIARYNLEKESMKLRNIAWNESCYYNDFIPYLIYENGLPFPSHSLIQGEFNENRMTLKAVNIAIRELLSRGIFIEDNGTAINLDENNYINLIGRLIRNNYDSVKIAKLMRSVYDNNAFPLDKYNPNPSLLYQPETMLRDPVYWHLIQYMLNYFSDFEKTLTPFDMSVYESDDFVITNASYSMLTTYFEYYTFSIDKAVQKENVPLLEFTARQRRLNHYPITFNFTITSTSNTNVVLRLFLGPACENETCWEMFDKFYQLDVTKYFLKEGENVITWNPDQSITFSSDSSFNKENRSHSDNSDNKFKNYNMFRFPNNLLLPRASENGLNFTTFVMVTKFDDKQKKVDTDRSKYYNVVSFELETKPLGFPFHRRSVNHNTCANNYIFYSTTIDHKKVGSTGNSGYFSAHLY